MKMRISEKIGIIYAMLLRKNFFVIEVMVCVFSVIVVQFFSTKILANTATNIYAKSFAELIICMIATSVFSILCVLIKSKIIKNYE